MATAEMYTFDGVVFPSTDPFPFDAVSKYFRADPLTYTPGPILPIERTIEETYLMSPRQMTAYLARSLCSVELDMWQYLWSKKDIDIYGNTGRPFKTPWKELTERTLIQGNVRTRFKEIFYRPSDISGIQSKGEAILRLLDQYETVTHYDNNPWIVFGLARTIPQAKFVLVQSHMSGTLYSQEQADAFGNVTVQWQLRYVESTIAEEKKKQLRKRNKKERSYFEERERQLRKKKDA